VSRKHNVAKQGRSNYSRRSGGGPMPTLESLRNKQPTKTDYAHKRTFGYEGLNFNQGNIGVVRGTGSGGDKYKKDR
jgi:hypothetical protein